jgi:tripartite-type tricarboxylate transporter receptor subunit TctC
MELFAAATGIKVRAVPFRGDSAAVTGLLGKTVDAIVTPGTVVFGNIQGGNFRALAITSSERWPALKDVPTVAETVSPGFENDRVDRRRHHARRTETHHRAAQPGHPRSHRVAEAVQEQSAQVSAAFPTSSTPEEATARVKKEIPLWKDLAEKAGIPKR